MMDSIRRISDGNQTNLMMNQRTLFHSASCEETDDVRDFLNLVENCQKKLLYTDSKIGNTELILKVCNSLPKCCLNVLYYFFDLGFLYQIAQRHTPIEMYLRNVHATENTELGGVKKGFFKVLNQILTGN